MFLKKTKNKPYKCQKDKKLALNSTNFKKRWWRLYVYPVSMRSISYISIDLAAQISKDKLLRSYWNESDKRVNSFSLRKSWKKKHFIFLPALYPEVWKNSHFESMIAGFKTHFSLWWNTLKDALSGMTFFYFPQYFPSNSYCPY